MGFWKLYLGSRDFVRHIYYIKSIVRPNFSDIKEITKIRIQCSAQDMNSGRLYYRADARALTQLLVPNFDRIHNLSKNVFRKYPR